MTLIVTRLLSYSPTPLQEIHHNALDRAGIRLIVKREDLNHPHVSGNKWWKLKYNLQEAVNQNKTILTFGGAYSNHIYATAAAAKELGLRSIGIIRGEETLPLNKTLSFAQQCGMELHYVSRDDYRKKNEDTFLEKLRLRFGDFYMIPEGGTNELAVKGCAEFASTFKDIDYDYLCLPVGTGGTIAGLIAVLDSDKEIIGFPVLKGGEYLTAEVENLLKTFSKGNHNHWHLDASFHHGGYAKTTPQLLHFIESMKTQHHLPLDFIYTGKLLWAIMQYSRDVRFQRGSTVLAIHTGGLQVM